MRLRVLIVEDDDVQATLLEGHLSSSGTYAEVVENGIDAVRRLRTGFFHAALIDYRMPEVDGVAVARVISESTRLVYRPRLIGLTASPQRLREIQAQGAPLFDAVEQKPIVWPKLMATLERCCGNAPAEPTALERTQCSPAAITSEQAARVLVVDDDVHLCRVAGSMLSSFGFAVETAENGFSALSAAEASNFDVIVMDYQMPEINGLAAAELIFDLFQRQDRPRFVAHTSAPTRLVQHASDWTQLFDEVVPKTAGLRRLAEVVGRCAEYRRLRRGVEPFDVISFSNLARIC